MGRGTPDFGRPGDVGRPNDFKLGLPFFDTMTPSGPIGGERADEPSDGGGGSCIPSGGWPVLVGERIGPGNPGPMPDGLICEAGPPFACGGEREWA